MNRGTRFYLSVIVFCFLGLHSRGQDQMRSRPNILVIISDDQGYPHASAYGCRFVQTPTFDAIAQQGILFTNFFVSAPHCSPSRAAILTGQHIWQNGPAGTHWSIFPAGLSTYTDILQQNGYEVGYTGKGWAPGNWIDGGRTTNPAGIEYISDKDSTRYNKTIPTTGISSENYVGSLELFLNKRDKTRPFCFWIGGWEPHLPYEHGSGLRGGKKLSSVDLPPFLAESDVIKSDLLDYALEIEWFDKQAGKALELLKENGLLDNTLVVFTSDNGMPFPRAKAFCFDQGNHVPLAIMWQGHITNPGRRVDDLISAVDLFPTFLQIAGLPATDDGTQGKSLVNIFESGRAGITDPSRNYVYWGRERHGNARWDNLGYPERAIRTHHYLYIWNLRPERYPAGSPQKITRDSVVPDYGDVGSTPSKSFMIAQKGQLFDLTFERFPREMLYDIRKDPYCMHDLSADSTYESVKFRLSEILRLKLMATGDPRMGPYPNIWESYRRYGPMHLFSRPAWADSIIKKSIIKQ